MITTYSYNVLSDNLNLSFHVGANISNLLFLYSLLKVVSASFLLVCFLYLKESTCETRKKCFLFHFESSFHFRDNQVLTFQIFKSHDVIKCLNMKHEAYSIE